MNDSSFESTGWNEPSYERRLEVVERIAREDALGRRLADALLDAREEVLRDGAAHDLLGELDALGRVRLELDPDVAEHPVAAGLLLVAAVGLGRAADRLPVRDLGRPGRDRRAELALEALADDGHVRLADGTQDLLAGGRPLDPCARLLLEHPLEGRAHLVEIRLRHGIDRDLQGRVREGDRGETQARVARAQGVPGLGQAQLGDGADLARPQLGRGLLLLAVEVQQLADALVLALGGVVDRALALERPGQDAEIGEAPDERVSRRLEHAHEELAAVGRNLDVLAGLVGRGERTLLVRRGEVAGDRVEQGVEADALGGRGDEHRGQDRVADPLVEAGVELRVRDLLFREVLLEDVVVGLGSGLEQLVAAKGDLVGEIGRDRDLDLLAVLELVGLAVDQIDEAGEGLRGADGQVERSDLVAECVAELIEHAERVRVLPVALVDDEAGRRAGGPAGPHRGLQPGFDMARCVDDEERGVRSVEPLDQLRDEVGVAGGVDERHLVLAVLERADGQRQRPVLLLLLGLEVEVRGPVVDPAQSGDGASPEHDLLRKGRLAAPGVAGEHDAADVGKVVALQRHRARFLSMIPPSDRSARPRRDVERRCAGCRHGSPRPDAGQRLTASGFLDSDDSRYTPARCQDIPSGPRSSARRAPMTPSEAPCSRRSHARSRWRPGQAAATPRRTTVCASRWTRHARSICPRTTSSGRSTKAAGGGEAEQYEEIVYEGYGPGGIAVLVEAATDNRNRTAAAVRSVFAKSGGQLAAAGAVAWQFEQRGLITVASQTNDPDEIALAAIDAGAEDVDTDADPIEIWTGPADLFTVRMALEGAGYKVEDAESAMVAKQTTVLEAEHFRKVMRIVDSLEELDDVQRVTTNADIPEELLAELGG